MNQKKYLETKISESLQSHLKTAIIAFVFFMIFIGVDYSLSYYCCSPEFSDNFLLDPMNYLKPLAAISAFSVYIYAHDAMRRYKDELMHLVQINTVGLTDSEKVKIISEFELEFSKLTRTITNKYLHFGIGMIFFIGLIFTASQSPKYGEEVSRYFNLSSFAYSFALGILLIRLYGWAQLLHLTTKVNSTFSTQYYRLDNLGTIKVMADIGKRAHKFSFSMVFITTIYIQIAITSIFQLLPLTENSNYNYLAFVVFWILFAITYCTFFMVSCTYHIYRFVEFGKTRQLRKLYAVTNKFISSPNEYREKYSDVSEAIKDVEKITSQVFGIKQVAYAIILVVFSTLFNACLYLFYSR